MMLVARELLERCVRIGHPTDTDTLYAKVATDYCVRWMGVALMMVRKNNIGPAEAMSARLKLVARFFEIAVSGYGAQQILVRGRSLLDELSDTIVDTMVQPLQHQVERAGPRQGLPPTVFCLWYGV